MNPFLTMGENIGDLTGLQFSYNAAFKNGGSLQEKRDFFLQYGKAWCGTMTKSLYEKRVKTDPHSQVPARVNVPISHISGFYEAFKCVYGQKMHVKKDSRIKIW